MSLEEFSQRPDVDSDRRALGQGVGQCEVGSGNAQVAHPSGSYAVRTLHLGGSDKGIPACASDLCIHGDGSPEGKLLLARLYVAVKSTPYRSSRSVTDYLTYGRVYPMLQSPPYLPSFTMHFRSNQSRPRKCNLVESMASA